MSADSLLGLLLLLPFLAAPLIVLCGRWPNLREAITLGAAGLTALLVLRLAQRFAAGETFGLSLGAPLPGLPVAFEVEPLGMLFALVAGVLWLVTSVYAIGYMRAHHEVQQTRFYAAFALSIGATLLTAFAANLFTLFLGYELLTLATWPLVTHSGTPEARRSGRIYLGLLLGTSTAFLLPAIVATWFIAGTLTFTEGGILAGKLDPAWAGLLYAFYLFGIGKAAVMPFHRWLPAAMVAPTPVSALLHAVAVVKAGVFSLLKVTVYVFGTDFVLHSQATDWLVWVAALTILAASLIAITRDNLKARLAYSTVSQLSYILLGTMLATKLALVGAALHIAVHAFAKITLFFAAGAILVAAHKTRVSELDGLGRAMPVTFTAFLIGSLSIIGAPLFGGMWSKWYLASGTVQAGQELLLAMLLFSTLLNIFYLLPIPLRGFFASAAPAEQGSGVREAPLTCVVAMLLTSLACILLFFSPQPFYPLARQLAGG